MLSRQMRQRPGALHRSRHPGRQKAAHSRQPGHLPAIIPRRAARLPGLQTYKCRQRHRRLLKTKTSGEEVSHPGLPCMVRPWERMRCWAAGRYLLPALRSCRERRRSAASQCSRVSHPLHERACRQSRAGGSECACHSSCAATSERAYHSSCAGTTADTPPVTTAGNSGT
jgi:hypothetical protein